MHGCSGPPESEIAAFTALAAASPAAGDGAAPPPPPGTARCLKYIQGGCHAYEGLSLASLMESFRKDKENALLELLLQLTSARRETSQRETSSLRPRHKPRTCRNQLRSAHGPEDGHCRSKSEIRKSCWPISVGPMVIHERESHKISCLFRMLDDTDSNGARGCTTWYHFAMACREQCKIACWSLSG